MRKFDIKILVTLADNGYELSTLELIDKLNPNPMSIFSGPGIGSIHEAGDRLEERMLIQKKN